MEQLLRIIYVISSKDDIKFIINQIIISEIKKREDRWGKSAQVLNKTMKDVNFGEVHGIILSVAWLVFAHVGIWALYFKHNRYALYLHILCMSCAGFLMAMGPIMMIVSYGPTIIIASVLHELWGFIQFCVLPFVLLSGAICKISKD